MPRDSAQDLIDAVKNASDSKTSLCIQGGNTKSFYGRQPEGKPLSTLDHVGIVDYKPTELVLTARGGTRLAEIESALGEQEQMLAFEPPHFGAAATLGGAVACGLSGPRRPYAGAVRDFTLGVRMVSGRGEDLKFGGQVMKNVAGYDVSRLMVGSMGTLGVLLDISLKVLPLPRVEDTLVFKLSPDEAWTLQNDWARKPSPISATSFSEGLLHIRLSGSEQGVRAARAQLGGEKIENGKSHWDDLKEQRHPFFAEQGPLWRISVPPATPVLSIPGSSLTEWGGALRWLITDAAAQDIRATVDRSGGHAALFRGVGRDNAFHPLSKPVFKLHENLKKAFDPAGTLNPGRMYAGV